jgi:hypothetical protein
LPFAFVLCARPALLFPEEIAASSSNTRAHDTKYDALHEHVAVGGVEKKSGFSWAIGFEWRTLFGDTVKRPRS